MNSEYDKLPQHKKADEGKKLYAKGKTITGNMTKTYITEAAIASGGTIAAKVLARSGNQTLATIAPRALVVGGTAVNMMLSGKQYSENEKLRAYYGHSK